jgi:hypothetical protein
VISAQFEPQELIVYPRGGSGTNGADGGNGGIIRICVDEDKTHLLQAVNWDVQGGKGGAAGRHGKRGRGGKGGRGGHGLKWFDA